LPEPSSTEPVGGPDGLPERPGGPEGEPEPARPASLGPLPEPLGGPDGVEDRPGLVLADDSSDDSSATPTEFALPPPCAQTRAVMGPLLAIAPIPRKNNQDREVKIGIVRSVDVKTVGRVIWQKSLTNMKIAMAAGLGKPKKHCGYVNVS